MTNLTSSGVTNIHSCATEFTYLATSRVNTEEDVLLLLLATRRLICCVFLRSSEGSVDSGRPYVRRDGCSVQLLTVHVPGGISMFWHLVHA